MTQDSLEKMKLWLSLWPESLHDKDEERKNEFVRSLKLPTMKLLILKNSIIVIEMSNQTLMKI